MKKSTIIIILLTVLIGGIIFSLYSTFAYNEEESKLDESNADYNLIYQIKENAAKNVIVMKKNMSMS